MPEPPKMPEGRILHNGKHYSKSDFEKYQESFIYNNSRVVYIGGFALMQIVIFIFYLWVS